MKRYWTLERLQELNEVLQEMGFCEGGQWYVGHDVALWPVHNALIQHGLSHPLSQTAEGLNLLLDLGLIAPGKPGPKRRSYRRPFYPELFDKVTEADIAARYQARSPQRGSRKNDAPTKSNGMHPSPGDIAGTEL